MLRRNNYQQGLYCMPSLIYITPIKFLDMAAKKKEEYK